MASHDSSKTLYFTAFGVSPQSASGTGTGAATGPAPVPSTDHQHPDSADAEFAQQAPSPSSHGSDPRSNPNANANANAHSSALYALNDHFALARPERPLKALNEGDRSARPSHHARLAGWQSPPPSPATASLPPTVSRSKSESGTSLAPAAIPSSTDTITTSSPHSSTSQRNDSNVSPAASFLGHPHPQSTNLYHPPPPLQHPHPHPPPPLAARAFTTTLASPPSALSASSSLSGASITSSLVPTVASLDGPHRHHHYRLRPPRNASPAPWPQPNIAPFMPVADSPLPRRQHPFHHQRVTATPPNSADSLTPTSAASRASSIAPPSELPERTGSAASMRTIKSTMSASGSVVGGFRPPSEGMSAASAFLYGPALVQMGSGLRTPLESINASNEFFPAWPHQLLDRPRIEMNRRASSPPRVIRPTSVVIPVSEARRLFPSATSTLQSTIPSPPPPEESYSPSPPPGAGATSKGTPPTVAEKLSKMSWRVKRTLGSLIPSSATPQQPSAIVTQQQPPSSSLSPIPYSHMGRPEHLGSTPIVGHFGDARAPPSSASRDQHDPMDIDYLRPPATPMRISDPFVGAHHEPIGLGLLPDSMIISPPNTNAAAAATASAMDVDANDARQSWPQLHHPQPHMHAHHAGRPSSPSSPASGSIASLGTSVPKHQPDVRLQIGFNPTPDAASILSAGSGSRKKPGHSRTGSNASARSLLVVPPSRDEDAHSTLGSLPDFGTCSSASSLTSPATGTPTVAVSNVVVPWTARTVSNTLGLAIATDGLAQDASTPASSTGAPSSIQSPVSASGQQSASQQGSIRARRLSKSLLTAPLLAQKPASGVEEMDEQEHKHPAYPIPTPPTLAHDAHHHHHHYQQQYEFPEFQPLTLASPNSTVAPMPVPMPKTKEPAFALPPSPRSSSVTHPTSSRPAVEDQNEPMIGSAPVRFGLLDSATPDAGTKEEARRRHTLDATGKKALSMSTTALSTSPTHMHHHHHRHHHMGLTDSPLMVGSDTPMDVAGPLGNAPTTPLPSSSSTSSSSQRLSHLVRRSSSTSLVLTKRPSLKRAANAANQYTAAQARERHLTTGSVPMPMTPGTPSMPMSMSTSVGSARSATYGSSGAGVSFSIGGDDLPSSPTTPMYPGHHTHHHHHPPPPMPSAPTSAAASFLAQFGSMPRSAGTTPGSPTMQHPSPLMHGHRPHSGAGPTDRKVSTDSVCSAGGAGRVPVSPALSFLSQFNSAGTSNGFGMSPFMDGAGGSVGGPGLTSPIPATGGDPPCDFSTHGSIGCDVYSEYGASSSSVLGHAGDLDIDMDVFASVWESGFLVEEGDTIEGGYVVGKPLGSGATSTVHVATRTHPESGQQWRYALKVVVDKSKLPLLGGSRVAPPVGMHDVRFTSDLGTVGPGVGIAPRTDTDGPPGEGADAYSQLEHEIAIWQHLHHPNIVDLCDVITTPECVFVFTELVTDGNLLELVNDWDRLASETGLWDLSHLLHPQVASPSAGPADFLMSHALNRAQNPPKSSGLPEHWVRRIARQVMSAMAYMHTEAGVVHRDIKLENSLVRLRHAASYTMHLREWREDSSGRTLGAQARDKAEVEVPLAVAGQWISSGMFSPVAPRGGGKSTSNNSNPLLAFRTASQGPAQWEARVSDAGNPGCTKVYRLSRRSTRRILDIEIKVADFGLSETLDAARDAADWCGGSLEYCPPESFDPVPDKAKKQIDKYLTARDVWSWGVLTYCLATGNLPFADAFEPRLVMKIRDYKTLLAPLPSQGNASSSGAAGFLSAFGRPPPTSMAQNNKLRGLDVQVWQDLQEQASRAMAQSAETLALASVPLDAQGDFAGLAFGGDMGSEGVDSPMSSGVQPQTPGNLPSPTWPSPPLSRGAVGNSGENDDMMVVDCDGDRNTGRGGTSDLDDGDAPFAIVYLPDQLARMMPEPGPLCWLKRKSQATNQVSPPLIDLFRSVFTSWDQRKSAAEVLQSEWMTL